MVRAQMSALKLAGGDTMNYWIEDFRPALLETIREWDFLLINDSEARLLSGERNLRRAAAAILEMGPHTLVIKRGEYGALLFRRDMYFAAPGYLLETLVDPTGAGDCFAGGFIGYLAGRGIERAAGRCGCRRTAPRRHLRIGDGQLLLRAVRRGPLPHARRDEIDARYQEFKPHGILRSAWFVAASLGLVSAAAVCFFSSRGWLLYYGDAEAHLNIARRIVDSHTPGYDQVGTVWLPLPHWLMLPLAGVDALVAQRHGGRHSLGGVLRAGRLVPVCGRAAHVRFHRRRRGRHRAVRAESQPCSTCNPSP